MEAVVGEGCARNFGQNLAAYSDLVLDINGHDDGLAPGNQHIGLDTPSVTRNTLTYQQLDKSQAEYYCANGYGCYGEQTEHILRNARSNPEPVATLKHYQIRERLNAQGLVVGYEAYNPESGNIIVMLPEELPRFRQVVEAIPAVGYSLEAMSHAEHTGANAQAGLYDQGYLMGIGDAAAQYATDPNTLFDIAIGGISAQASGQVFRFVPKRGQVDGGGLIGEGYAGRTAADAKYFINKTQYQAPENGTGKIYTVYQQDIDPDLVITTRTGVITTNRELMEKGRSPYIVKDGKLVEVQLHHSRQNANGPLFEVSKTTHQAKTGSGGETLHPYKTKLGRANNGDGSGENKSLNPSSPLTPEIRNQFDRKDRPDYWKKRAEDVD